MTDDDKLDLLRGADQISNFMFGTPEARRQVYHLFECHDLPAFKMGNTLYARKPTLAEWIAKKEKR